MEHDDCPLDAYEGVPDVSICVKLDPFVHDEIRALVKSAKQRDLRSVEDLIVWMLNSLVDQRGHRHSWQTELVHELGYPDLCEECSRKRFKGRE